MKIELKDGFTAVDENGIRCTVTKEAEGWSIKWRPVAACIKPVLSWKLMAETTLPAKGSNA